MFFRSSYNLVVEVKCAANDRYNSAQLEKSEYHECMNLLLMQITYLAVLPCNTGFGPGFSYIVINRTCHVIIPIWRCIDWFAGPKTRFAELEMDKTGHLKLCLPLSGRSKHLLQ